MTVTLAMLVADLTTRMREARLDPTDQVRVLAALLTDVGWILAQPGLAGDRATLEAQLARRGDLASALILQGAILREWVDDGTPGEIPEARAVDKGGATLR